jgi:hypothetical protein
MVDVGGDIDGNILPGTCPESVKRMISRLVVQGHLRAVGRKYEVADSALQYLTELHLRTPESIQELTILSSTEFQCNEDTQSC